MAMPDRGIVFRSRWVVHVIRALKETYASDLELRRFGVALFPRIRITGEGLVFRYQGRIDVPPLISVEKFSANTNWIAVLGKRRIRRSTFRLSFM